MKNLRTTLFLFLLFTTITHAMEQQELTIIPSSLPEELSGHIIFLPLQNARDYFSNLEEARDYLVCISSLNKNWHDIANRQTNTITFIRNLSQAIRTNGGCAEIAQKLNTPGTRNYKCQSKQLFNTNLTPEKIEELKKQGADLDYTFSHHKNGFYNWPLHCWVVAKNYDNVKKLLELGADIDQSYTNHQQYSCVACAFSNDAIEILTLLLSYKPKNVYLSHALQWHGNNEEIVPMLLAATKENSKNLQLDLDRALNGAFHTQSNIKPVQIKLLLDEGAQPESILKGLVSWILGSKATCTVSRAPSLDILQLLCNYPATDMTQVENAREVARDIQNMAEEILKILDVYPTK